MGISAERTRDIQRAERGARAREPRELPYRTESGGPPEQQPEPELSLRARESEREKLAAAAAYRYVVPGDRSYTVPPRG